MELEGDPVKLLKGIGVAILVFLTLLLLFVLLTT